MGASAPTGILVVDKPGGMSSHAVVSRVRKWFGTSKVGHAGTLDPMATGVLVLGLGKGTKLLTYLVGADKTYSATIRLGVGTPTDDADSAPDRFAPADAIRNVDQASIARGVERLTGNIEQVPSAVSAIKVDGKRAYDLVRAGEDVQLKARTVTVSRFEVSAPELRACEYDASPACECVDLEASVDCSSGTYIRALARDLGDSLGVYGHLTQLRRDRVGPFTLDRAVELPPYEALGERVEPAPLISLAEVASAVLPTVELSREQAVDVAHGKFIDVPAGSGERVCAGLYDGILVAVLESRAGGRALKAATGFAQPADLNNH